MRNYIFALMTVGLLTLPASAMAQQVTTYYYGAPTPYYSAAPAYTTGPVTVARASYYSPAPVSYYSPYASSYTSPYSAAYAAPYTSSPVVYGRPTYPFYSAYGGAEVRVPGQPIRNTLRTIFP